MIECPHCKTREHQVKCGCNNCGSQRYLCKQCQRRYVAEPKVHGYSNEVRRQAVELYLEGNSFRAIGRILKVNYQSVANWVNACAAQLPSPEMPTDPKVGEMDELFTYIGDKKKKYTY
jgi:transposase-like protein